METIKLFILYCICITNKYLSVRYSVGLIKIGNPTNISPVFVSGNYFLTVRRLIHVLKQHHCYLLVADSAGINVWCAAGVGDFNEHKIADAVNSTNLDNIVDHRILILPQLCAVGVDINQLYKECGFKTIWGPANLLDIPKFIQKCYINDTSMRLIRFSITERLCNLIGMFFVFIFPLSVFLLFFPSLIKYYTYYCMITFAIISLSYLLFHVFPFRFPSNNTFSLSILLAILGFIYIYITNQELSILIYFTITTLIIGILIAIDMLGSSPFYKTTILHWIKHFDNNSLFQPIITENCTSCQKCLQVCPKDVFIMYKDRVTINNKSICCECLACVKQCPNYSIRNKNKNIYKKDIQSIPFISEIMK